MTTLLRPELSERNKYWIGKNRYYELKHFCLQYLGWKKTYAALNELGIISSAINGMPSGGGVTDLTSKYAIRKAHYANRIKMVEEACQEADEDLYLYLLRGVTEGVSFTQLDAVYHIPCSRDTYYDRYRKFFWILNEKRD